jgi:hypothetical protein
LKEREREDEGRGFSVKGKRAGGLLQKGFFPLPSSLRLQNRGGRGGSAAAAPAVLPASTAAWERGKKGKKVEGIPPLRSP